MARSALTLILIEILEILKPPCKLLILQDQRTENSFEKTGFWYRETFNVGEGKLELFILGNFKLGKQKILEEKTLDFADCNKYMVV